MSLKVFISWSGNESQYVASHLRTLIKRICVAADPWMSNDDLAAGTLWPYTLMTQLQSTHFGIICVDRANLNSPWLHFEAGALAKSLDNSAVLPYLKGLPSSSLSGPLTLFQSVGVDRAGTFKLLDTLNRILRDKQEAYQSEDDLKTLFDLLWPGYAHDIEQYLNTPLDAGPERSDTEILSELLNLSRTHSRVLASILRASPTYRPPIQVADQVSTTAFDEDFQSLNFEELRYNAKKLRRNGQYADALDLFKKALALRPDDLETLIDIAVTETYLEDCGYDESIKKLEALVKEHATKEKASLTAEGIIAKAFYNLACIKQISGAYSDEDVMNELECALQRNPIYATKALEDRDLRPLKSNPRFMELIEKYWRDER